MSVNDTYFQSLESSATSARKPNQEVLASFHNYNLEFHTNCALNIPLQFLN